MFALSLFVVVGSAALQATTLLQWDSVQFDWQSAAQKQKLIAQGFYIDRNCAIAGVKSYQGTVFVSVPRWKTGVPATFHTLDQARQVLTPWPSWSAQALDNANSLFWNVQSMEIDPIGRLWLLDVGRMNFLDSDPSTVVNRAPALLLFDLNTGVLLDSFVFDDAVLPANASFANDLVLDWRNDVAFISDTWGSGGLVVVDLGKRWARRFDHPSLQGDPNGVMVFPEGRFAASSPSDGIALAPNGTLIYCTISKTQLWQLDSAVLADSSSSAADIAATVQFVGDKGVFSDGLAMTNESVLIWGDLAGGRVVANSVVLAAKPLAMEWPDTFAFDETDGSLLFTSNRLQLFLNRTMSNSTVNFRLWRLRDTTTPIYSYMF
jgi:hypothetical protein